MSRLAKQPIKIPTGVEVSFASGVLSVKGPKGALTKNVGDYVGVAVKEGNAEIIIPAGREDELNAMSGTVASHLMNLIEGVTKGFEKKIILEGIGYKADVKGKELVCALGFSHPVNIAIPEGLEVKSEKGTVTVSGINKEEVGSFSAYIRSQKKPEPYKGKGFHYDGEIVVRKQGKKSV